MPDLQEPWFHDSLLSSGPELVRVGCAKSVTGLLKQRYAPGLLKQRYAPGTNFGHEHGALRSPHGRPVSGLLHHVQGHDRE